MKPTAPVALAAGALLIMATALVAAGFAQYPGSGFNFVFFNICFFALVVLIFPRPRLYVYTFLAVLLFLGFWMKVVVQTIWALGFIEAVGNFANTPEEWNNALIAATCGALGVIAARCGHLWFRRKTRGMSNSSAAAGAPGWFVRWRQPIWMLTIVLVIGLNVANLRFAFFQIGVNPKLIFPMHLNVVLAWLVNIGFALWIASLVWWDFNNRPQRLRKGLIMPILEAFLSSLSAFSRLSFLLHAGPYWITIFECWQSFAGVLRRRALAALAVWFLILFVLSILLVFWLRVLDYYGYSSAEPPAEPQIQHFQRTIVRQLSDLLVHRWVGLEGVLTAGATKNRGPALFAAMVKEDPALGARSIYQQAARPGYRADQLNKFTFLSNAGPIALLLFSGSLAVVIMGMTVVTLLLILTEETTKRWTGNPFLLAVGGAGIANVVIQTTFPYLTVIFLLQLWVAIAFLALIQHIEPTSLRSGPLFLRK